MAELNAAYMAEMAVIAEEYGAPPNLFGDKPIFDWGYLFYSIRFANRNIAAKRYRAWKTRTNIIPAQPIFVPINFGVPPVQH